MPTHAPSWSHLIRLADQATHTDADFDLGPDAETRGAIARHLGITAVRKLRFAGRIAPLGSSDWQLDAVLGATVVQPCVATLAPVTTRIDEKITRRYLADLPEADPPGETEMPEDDSAEPLPDAVDIGAVMVEALALALPAYPRASGADPVSVQVTEPGKTPMRDEDARAFARLAALRDKLSKDQ